MNGGGGGLSSEESAFESSQLLNNKPAHEIAKDVFVQKKQEADSRSDANSDAVRTAYNKQQSKQIESRVVKLNPATYKELTNKMNEDLAVITNVDKQRTAKITANVPAQYKLYQNYPNPFNPTTTIKYDIPKNGNVTLKIYDLLGRELYSVNEYKVAGTYQIKFDGTNYASGLYFYRLEAGSFVEVKKMVLIK